jgi:hypothetical protein
MRQVDADEGAHAVQSVPHEAPRSLSPHGAQAYKLHSPAVGTQMKAIDQGARSFTQRKQKAATERPANLAPIVGNVISEADADVD